MIEPRTHLASGEKMSLSISLMLKQVGGGEVGVCEQLGSNTGSQSGGGSAEEDGQFESNTGSQEEVGLARED